MASKGIQISYYDYNAFIIEKNQYRIAIDPGTSLYLLNLGTLIPKEKWEEVTHILVTHGDPDHYWNADRVAEASGAPLICGSELVQVRDGESFIVSPRTKKFQHATQVSRVYPLDHGQKIDVDGISVKALPATHGDLTISLLFGVARKTITRRPGEHFAVGETGFLIETEGVTLANLGDTLPRDEWNGLKLDILMIPIGGKSSGNTMDEGEALKAVEMIQPDIVIPCHYNCGFLFSRHANPADEIWFRDEVKKQGKECLLMKPGDILSI
jgi:L-ascorbate metabolism protein UlaG (beta-lactamase superfamily)